MKKMRGGGDHNGRQKIIRGGGNEVGENQGKQTTSEKCLKRRGGLVFGARERQAQGREEKGPSAEVVRGSGGTHVQQND